MKQAISLSLFLIVGAHLVTAKFDFKWPLSWPQLPSWAIPNNRKFNGLTDPMTVPKINDACAVNHEGRTFHGKCQSEAIGPSGGCPNDVSLYGCGAERGDGNPIRCCVQVRCAPPWNKWFCKNTYKRSLFYAFQPDPNICPFGEDILCWDYDLAEAGHQYAQADGGGLDQIIIPQTASISIDPTLSLQPSSGITPANPPQPAAAAAVFPPAVSDQAAVSFNPSIDSGGVSINLT